MKQNVERLESVNKLFRGPAGSVFDCTVQQGNGSVNSVDALEKELEPENIELKKSAIYRFESWHKGEAPENCRFSREKV